MSDLWPVVDQLTQPYRQRLERDHGPVEWIELPSLLHQLGEAVTSGAGGSARGKQGSRPPLDISCMSLLFEIVNDVRDGLRGLDVKRSFDTSDDIRSLASELLRHPDEADAIDWWIDRFRSWCGQIKAAISSEPDRPKALWDVACPECKGKFVFEPHDDEPVKRAAVFVHWAGELVRAVECRACTAVWYRGTDLEQLVERMMSKDDAAVAENVA